MTSSRTDDEIIQRTHNTARFFVESRQVAWVLFVMTFLWGFYGYSQMPKRKDPDVPATLAVAICPWPGASAERIEQLVTRKLEERIAENAKVARVESISRSGVSIVYFSLDERITEPGKEFDDIRLRLDSIRDLPEGAGPIDFQKDFADTATLMLTLASPKVSAIDVELRARTIASAIQTVRQGTSPTAPRVTLLVCFPESISSEIPRRQRDLLMLLMKGTGGLRDARTVDGAGFTGVDMVAQVNDETMRAFIKQTLDEWLHASEFHPDTWSPALIHDPAETAAKLREVAGDKYSYRELDDYSDLVKHTLQSVPQVSKVSRAGLLKEEIYLEYSQEMLAGMQHRIADILRARNITLPGGVLEIAGKNIAIDPSGDFKAEREIGDVIVGTSASGRPVYLRDSVTITRGYENPARFLNFARWKDTDGQWRRSRSVTLAIQMRPGEQIQAFGEAVNAALAGLKGRLPEDLIVNRLSDQQSQVQEGIELFSVSLIEAIVLVVLVALVGFWEWRSAALVSLSIPLTLALTFGGMRLLGLDVQQVSLASLIIALGLLVDDPVVAGDAIKRELDAGHPPLISAWLGPTKLATAIMFATITNIVAYLPLLLVTGDVGHFLYSLPVVLACSLVMSRLVSMSFIPLLSYYLLRPAKGVTPSLEARRTQGFSGWYCRVADRALQHRWLTLGGSLVLLGVGLFSVRGLKTEFFPTDRQYLSYADVWLPEDATLTATNDTAERVEQVITDVASKYGQEHPGPDGKPRQVLDSLTTYVGGGGPRFWLSIFPELFQSNYAQVIIKVRDKDDTPALAPGLQTALSSVIAGARVDMRQLETGKPVGIPVSLRISGTDIGTLRGLAEDLKQRLRAIPSTRRVRDDWGAESFVVSLQVDPDRANFAGVSNQDVALSSAVGMNGFEVTTLREQDKEIPVVARLRPEERARLSDIRNLYVYSATGAQKVPLGQVSTIAYDMKTQKVRHRNQFRTITVSAFPAHGVLSSDVLGALRPQLAGFERSLPPGYRLEIGGEEEEAVKGFGQLSTVMAISIVAIFVALVFQFRHAAKPLIVFSAIPYGIVGSLVTLSAIGLPFGFMAFLGLASLIGVIVSHVIVLFDFIEEAHSRGEPLRDALLDAGVVRLRPVMITVGATVFGLIPLAVHGGPLWQPLCFAQIGGLTVATFVTLLLVPVLYAIFVLDLRIVKWTNVHPESAPEKS